MLTEDEEEEEIVSTAADVRSTQPPHAGSEACDDMVQRLDNPRGTFLTVGSDGVVWYTSGYSQRFNLR